MRDAFCICDSTNTAGRHRFDLKENSGSAVVHVDSFDDPTEVSRNMTVSLEKFVEYSPGQDTRRANAFPRAVYCMSTRARVLQLICFHVASSEIEVLDKFSDWLSIVSSTQPFSRTILDIVTRCFLKVRAAH